MSSSIGPKQRQGLIRGFLSKLRFPQLFVILLGLFAVDMVLPDPMLLVDEAILGVLAVMMGMWRRRGVDSDEEPTELRDITPKNPDGLR